jgi:uncharacterized membrane protein YkvA (DUF1232 family)
MLKGYKKTAQVGIVKACLRFIEDPNRNIAHRAFLALSPVLIVSVLSPLDLMPEILLGPLGLTDDILIIIGLVLLTRLANSFYKEKKYDSSNKTINRSHLIDV